MIDINTLSQRLNKRLQDMSIIKTRERARVIAVKMSKVAEKWQKEMYKALSKPAITRGYFRKSKLWLNPHDKSSYNGSFPMLVTGRLRASIYQYVSVRDTKRGAAIKINRGFHKVGSEVGGYKDYGDYLDNEHELLSGWKERAYDKLDERIYNKA